MFGTRRNFLKMMLGCIVGFAAGKALFGAPVSAEADEAAPGEILYKVGDAVPKEGRYRCIVCGFVVEYLPRHIERGVIFAECTLCHSGTARGHKKAHEPFWRYVGPGC